MLIRSRDKKYLFEFLFDKWICHKKEPASGHREGVWRKYNLFMRDSPFCSYSGAIKSFGEDNEYELLLQFKEYMRCLK